MNMLMLLGNVKIVGINNDDDNNHKTSLNYVVYSSVLCINHVSPHLI